jgi:hypothetical protein
MKAPVLRVDGEDNRVILAAKLDLMDSASQTSQTVLTGMDIKSDRLEEQHPLSPRISEADGFQLSRKVQKERASEGFRAGEERDQARKRWLTPLRWNGPE